MGNVRTRAYRNGVLADEDFPVAAVSEHLEDDRTVVCIDFLRPDASDFDGLTDELGLHALAIEDALEPHQRPKIDHYPSHLFLASHAVHFDAAHRRLGKTEIDAFVGDRWLVTVRSDDAFSMEDVVKRWDSEPNLSVHGVGALVYTLLDDVVDGYYTVIDDFDSYYDGVSDAVFADHPLLPEQQRNWYEMRRALSQFYRVVLPTREMLSSVVRSRAPHMQPEVLPYWRDLEDHIMMISERTDGLRDVVNSLVDANLALRDYRQNQVVKTVSSWAAIVAAPTLVTGYYGMNVPYPGSGDPWGVVASAVIIVGLSVGLYLLFRRNGWL